MEGTRREGESMEQRHAKNGIDRQGATSRAGRGSSEQKEEGKECL